MIFTNHNALWTSGQNKNINNKIKIIYFTIDYTKSFFQYAFISSDMYTGMVDIMAIVKIL